MNLYLKTFLASVEDCCLENSIFLCMKDEGYRIVEILINNFPELGMLLIGMINLLSGTSLVQ